MQIVSFESFYIFLILSVIVSMCQKLLLPCEHPPVSGH